MAELIKVLTNKDFIVKVVSKDGCLTNDELRTFRWCFRLAYELELGWYQKGRPSLGYVLETIEENDMALARKIESMEYYA